MFSKPLAAVKDAYHRPKAPSIAEEARAWVVAVACRKPKDLGYAAELWTRSALAAHVRAHAVEAGHPSLAKAAKATVQRTRRTFLRRHRHTWRPARTDFDTC